MENGKLAFVIDEADIDAGDMLAFEPVSDEQQALQIAAECLAISRYKTAAKKATADKATEKTPDTMAHGALSFIKSAHVLGISNAFVMDTIDGQTEYQTIEKGVYLVRWFADKSVLVWTKGDGYKPFSNFAEFKQTVKA